MARPEKCCVAHHVSKQAVSAQRKSARPRSAACLLRVQLFLLPGWVSKQGSGFDTVLVYPFSNSVNTVEHLLCSRPGARGYGCGPCPQGDYSPFRGQEVNRWLWSVLSAPTDVGTGCCAVILGGVQLRPGGFEKVTPLLNPGGPERVFL